MNKFKIMVILGLLVFNTATVSANASTTKSTTSNKQLVWKDTEDEEETSVSNDISNKSSDEYKSLVTLKTVDNGWSKDSNGYWYFFKNGIKQVGWHQENGNWYFLESNGMMATSQWIGSSIAYDNTPKGYYVGSDGKWQQSNINETRPVYGTVTLNNPNLNKYYKWDYAKATFKYYEFKKEWVCIKRGSGFLGKSEEFAKYLKNITPIEEGKDGEEIEYKVHIYLG